MEPITIIICSLIAGIIILSIIHDNKKDRENRKTKNHALDYHRKKYLKELKDGEK